MFRLGLSRTAGTNSLPLTNQWTASRNFVISNQSAYAPSEECHTITEFQAQTKIPVDVFTSQMVAPVFVQQAQHSRIGHVATLGRSKGEHLS